MSLRNEALNLRKGRVGLAQLLRERSVQFVAFSWGFCAYVPIGVLYLNFLLLLVAIGLSPNIRQRLRQLPRGVVFLPVVVMLAWTLIVAGSGEWLADTSTRLFHVFRVALLLFVGMMLTRREVCTAFAAFLMASVIAALLVAIHHVWGLPEWTLWNSLLVSRNNFSSGNMISMATAFGICVWLGLRRNWTLDVRWIFLAVALALGATVSLHALSRNAHLLLGVLLVVVLMYRFRSLRARLLGLACATTLFGALLQLSPMTHDRFMQLAVDLQAASRLADYSTSAGVRWRMIQEAMQGMVDYPAMGTGLGTWLPHWSMVWESISQDLPVGAQREFSQINNPHNDFLLSGMETGVPGMLVLVWLLLRAMRHAWRRESTMGGISAVMCATVATTAMVNAPFRDAALGMTLLWLLGASLVSRRSVV